MLRSDVIPIDRFPIEDPIAERVRQIQLGFNELRLYEAHVGTQEDPSQHEALGAFQLGRDAQLEVVDMQCMQGMRLSLCRLSISLQGWFVMFVILGGYLYSLLSIDSSPHSLLLHLSPPS